MADSIVSLHLDEHIIRLGEGKYSQKKILFEALTQSESIPNLYANTTDKMIVDTGKFIEKLYTSAKLHKKNTHIIMPDSFSYSQILEMPKLKEKELLSAIRYQADQFIPLPLEETALDIDILYEDVARKRILVLIVASAQNIINTVTQAAEYAGLIPESVENELSAVSRFVSELYVPKDTTHATLFINMGYSSTSLYLYHPGMHIIADAHSFKIGFDLLLKELQVNLNFDLKKSEEVMRTIGFASNSSVNLTEVLNVASNDINHEVEVFMKASAAKFNIPVSQIYLINYGSRINLFAQHIQEIVKVPASNFDSSSFIAPSPMLQLYKPQLASFISVAGGFIT